MYKLTNIMTLTEISQYNRLREHWPNVRTSNDALQLAIKKENQINKWTSASIHTVRRLKEDLSQLETLAELLERVETINKGL